MPRIQPGQLKDMAQRMAANGQLSATDVGKLIDTAMAEGTLTKVAKKELKEILNQFQDKMDSPQTQEQFKAFLSIPGARVRNLAYTLQKDDGVIDASEAGKLVDLVNANGKVSKNEKYSLAAVMVANKMTPDAKVRIDGILDPSGPAPTGNARSLGNTDSYRPVFLTPGGHFVEDAAAGAPQNITQLGSGMFRMADLVDDAKVNPLDAANVPLAERAAALQNLTATLATVGVGAPLPAGLTDKQALQLRSSSATVLLALVEGAGNGGDEKALKDQALRLYTNVVGAETNPILRDSMVWNLSRVAGGLPADLKAVAQPLVDSLAPKSPPYDDWFKDGNKTLNVRWATGSDEEFFPGAVDLLEKRGFKPEGNVPARGPATLVKKFTRPGGEEVEVRIKVAVNHSDIFKDMNKKDVHIVGYDGHSDIGRTVPGSLRGAPDEVGHKLIFTGLCAGKDNLHNMRDRYPDSQVITTFTSSYFNTAERNGKKIMSRSENLNTLMELVDGAVKRSDWNTINKNIRDKAVLFPYSHVMPGGTNYVSPAHTEIRRKVLDSDHDGQADYLDKFANFDVFKVKADTAREFNPVKAARPAEVLDGTVTHMAAQALNTATGYNSITKDYKRQSILGAGYFQPQSATDPVVRFEPTRVDGQDVLHMKVNADYAHMTVESLRAVAQYQFMQEIAPGQGLDKTDTKLMGLVFAAFSILYDEARWGRDDTIWSNLLSKMGLPSDIPFAPFRELLDEEHHDYSGNMAHVRTLHQQLPASVITALGA